ncbi:GNAT family N-acetyltransferase [Desulfobaculum sp. SPO524]|uniref:GNAT family N-acetyltransferase n=1 Tax=Desulfobaculum sp. SPO524 TaxID=3378071 RepID=UPI003854F62D
MTVQDDVLCVPADFIRRDEWLELRLARPCFAVDGCILSGLDAMRLREALGELLCVHRVFVSTRILADAAGTGCVLRHMGFTPVVTAVSMERPLDEPMERTGPLTIRLARASDEGAVRRIARESFHSSRFHRDPMIPKPVANSIKEDWARNFFLGQRGDAMVVAENADGEVAGFALFLCRGQELVLDLIAVDDRHRGFRAGGDMMAFASRELGRFAIIRTVTQAENMQAMACYHRAGFASVTVERIFHYHGAQDDRCGEC